jgi:hypothetical protein
MEYMDPPQICKLASLNRAFRAASSADFVWESKLPPNYDVIISKIFDTSFPSQLGKRGIYSRLCSLNNTFDGGTKKVWLDRSMGKLCLSISAKGLSITYIDDRRYWNHIPTEEDLVVLHISNKSGGLKWMVKLSSHFQLEHIAYSSDYI